MKNLFSLLGALLLIFLITDVSGQTINDYKWLEGRYLNDAEANVERMGFARTDAIQKGRDLHEYYWNSSDKFCLAMVSHLGRIDRVFKGTRSDCNQKADMGALAVGAVAAAILGSALLTSKSNDREKHVDNKDADEVAAFDRGYRDGLYNKTYHNVYRETNDRNAYSSGYTEGTDRHKHETAHNTGFGNNIGHVNIGDLYNKNRVYVENQMKQRGFQMMNKQTNNWGSHEYWYSYETNQCYDLTITNNKGLETIRTAQAYHCQEHQASYHTAGSTTNYKNNRFTNYNATGSLSCQVNRSWQDCDFGVQRHGFDRADVYIKLPDGSERVFSFNGGRVNSPSKEELYINKTREEWIMSLGSNTFKIPVAIINGD